MQTSIFSERERVPRAVFSECEEHWGGNHFGECLPACRGKRYRYELWWPTGVDNDRICLGLFANASTGTADALDPTLTRWRNFCRDWGYGWSVTCNVRAWRETKPKLVPPDPRAIGPENDKHILALASIAEMIVVGWGKLGGKRGPEVLELIRSTGIGPNALKLNKDGTPAHPLYLRSDLRPFPMGLM